MKTYPARLVALLETEPDWSKLISADFQIGDVVIFRVDDGSRRIFFRCACAFGRHEVPLKPYAFEPAWDLVSVDPPHIEPSLLTKGNTWVCHLFLRAGQLQILDDTRPFPNE